MFNTTNQRNNQNVEINAVNGLIVKNYKKSFFQRFNLKSEFAEDVFDTNFPHIHRIPIVILQLMMCGNMEVIAEIMWKEDFDEMYKESEET